MNAHRKAPTSSTDIDLAVHSALEFIENHGVVLVSARGRAPRLIDSIAGEPVTGNWWSHPRARWIYAVLSSACDSDEVLVCRLVDGKVTLVHRRLWPALARLAHRFAADRVARVCEEHTASGRHVTHDVPFPDWLPTGIAREAKQVDESTAVAVFERWLDPPAPVKTRVRRR